MATATRETERKYEAEPDAPHPDLSDLPDVASRADTGEVTLEATYYDTASLDLLRAGITLRRRTGGADAGWHLKLPSGKDSRTELRLPLGGDGPPEEFTGLLTARLLGREVSPVATITTARSVTTLADTRGEPLAEVAFDRIAAARPGGSASPTRWDEVEFELAEGARDGARLLKAADRSLRRAGLRRSRRRTKLEAVLAGSLPVPASREELSPRSSTAEVLAAYLGDQFEELRLQDARVRREEPEAVHDMRVAARRMRAVLQEFGRLFQPVPTEILINELRWLGQELGRPRDEEVLGGLLLAQLGTVEGASVMGLVQARIAGHYATSTAAATTEMHRALASERYLDLIGALEAFVACPRITVATDGPAGEVLPPLVDRSRRRVDRRMRRARQAPRGTARDQALHGARKAAKRARYAAEAVSPVIGKKARRTAKSFKRVQSALGDHHDAVIAADALRDLAVRARGEGESTFTYGLLHERQAWRARRLEKQARRAWKRSRASKRTAWMRTDH
ncbi:MAG TPA: CYTH and CHAD domain-containing protein [Actinospica sp.]|nr:CYTH and CHAD domain-containing protein [Actinospica sp.]